MADNSKVVSPDQQDHQGEILTPDTAKGDVDEFFCASSLASINEASTDPHAQAQTQTQAQTQLQPQAQPPQHMQDPTPEIDFDPQGIFESRLDFAFEPLLWEEPSIDPFTWTTHTPATAITSNVVSPNHVATLQAIATAAPQLVSELPQQGVGITEMVLNIEDPFAAKYYTNRNFPSFGVTLTTNNHQPVAGCHIVLVTLNCGNPNNPPPPNSHTILHDSRKQGFGVTAFEYAVVNGHGTVEGLKFLKVSSKHGGGFFLRLTLRDKPEVFALSNKIVVRSCRTIHTQKAGIMSRVQSQSPVSTIPSIGRCYSKRLMGIGVRTAAHLAWLHSDKEMQRKVFDSIYKTRGTLTESTLGALCARLALCVEMEEPALHSLVNLSKTSTKKY